MKRDIMRIAIMVAVVCFFNVSVVFPQQESMPYENEKAKNAETEPNKEEIIMRINNVLAYHPDMLTNVPGVTGTTNEEGILSYEYEGLPLESIDRGTLLVLLQSLEREVSWTDLVSGESDSPDYKQGEF